jgi:tetratricopeptide (TPR) repeat protein
VDLPTAVSGRWARRVFIFIVAGVTLHLVFSTFSLYDIDTEYARAKTLIGQSEVNDGVSLLQDAVDRFPSEPVYRDELAYTAARLAYALSTTGESTKAANLAQAAIDHSDIVIQQNSHNVNFYKTRVRIFSLLARITPVFYDQANQALKIARELSPTDPKLTYNVALIAQAQNKDAEYENALKDTIALRPIDIQAHLDLGHLYENQKKAELAKEQYNLVLQLDPKNDEARIRLASTSAKVKK